MSVRLDDDQQIRVHRTFAFFDLLGFTAYTEIHGDRAAVEVLTGFRTAVRDVAEHHAVRIAKWLGDGAMLVSADERRCVEAAIDIGDRVDASASPLALRAGVASGPVLLLDGDDYIGAAVNLAARLCDAAEPREVLAPASLMSPSMVNSHGRPIGARAIRGLAEPIEVVSLADANQQPAGDVDAPAPPAVSPGIVMVDHR